DISGPVHSDTRHPSPFAIRPEGALLKYRRDTRKVSQLVPSDRRAVYDDAVGSLHHTRDRVSRDQRFVITKVAVRRAIHQQDRYLVELLFGSLLRDASSADRVWIVAAIWLDWIRLSLLTCRNER